MKKRIRVVGFAYQLRPVTIDDAQLIIDIRLQDEERNRYIHRISSDVSEQEAWIRAYLQRENDYYFVVENIFSGSPEGLISIYDICEDKAEWGRWVIKKGSLATIESVYLIMRVAFEKLGLSEVYSRTMEKNINVVSFHESIQQKFRRILENYAILDGEECNAVEHYMEKEYYQQTVEPLLYKRLIPVFKRNFEMALGGRPTFHHIGIATQNIYKELPFFSLLGYKISSELFSDERQGIRGCFLEAKNQPCIELLENLPDSTTLDSFLESGQKMYHMAYYVDDVNRAVGTLQKCRAKMLKGQEQSVYFGDKICFMVLPNGLMIELLQGKDK